MIKPVEKQTCKECHIEKPVNEFHRKGAGFQRRCKLCRNAREKAYYKQGGVRSVEIKEVPAREHFEIIQSRIEALTPKLKNIARSVSTSEMESEDIFQTILEKILVKCLPKDTDAYFLRCGRYAALNYLNQRSCYDFHVGSFGSDENDSVLSAGDSLSAEDEFIRRETLAEIEQVRLSLPAKYQEIIDMLFLDCKRAEMAETLQVSKVNVSQKIIMLRKELTASGYSGLVFQLAAVS